MERAGADPAVQAPDPAAQAGPSEAPAAGLGQMSTASVLLLQRTAGNAATQRIVRASVLACNGNKPAGPPAPAPPTPGPEPGPAPGGGPLKVIAPPPANGPTFRHSTTGVVFSADKEHVKYQLANYVAEHGLDSLGRFEGGDGLWVPATGNPFPAVQDANAPAADTSKEDLQKVVKVVHEEVVALGAHILAFRDYFRGRAGDTLRELLLDSEKRLKKELEQYGIKDDSTRVFGVNVWESYKGADNKAGDDLGKDARALKAKLVPAQAAKIEFDAARNPQGYSARDPGAMMAMRAQLEAASTKLGLAQKEYGLERARVEQLHPALLAYNLSLDDQMTGVHLDKLGSEKAEDRAQHVGEELNKRLGNIEKVRKKEIDDKQYVWTLETLVGVTRQLADIKGYELLKHEGMQTTVVAEARAKAEFDKEIVSVGLGIVALGLGMIAAIPTGGLSVAGAAAAAGGEALANVALAYRAYQAYDLATAEAGTDYDKAKALSAEEPSLFWLALDMVGAAASVAGGLKAAAPLFRAAAAAREEALAAKTAQAVLAGRGIDGAEGYKNAVTKLEKVGNEAKTGAGKALVEEVERLPPGKSRSTVVGEEPGPASLRTPEAHMTSKEIADLAKKGEGFTRDEATIEYFGYIIANPDMEYAVVKNSLTNRYRALPGVIDKVAIPGEWGDGWSFVRHYHPNLEEAKDAGGRFGLIPADSKKTIFGARLPSAIAKGGPGDLLGARLAAIEQGGRPVSETLDYWDPGANKMKTTKFGWNGKPGAIPEGLEGPPAPRDKPFWAEFEETSGQTVRHHFRSSKEAQAQLNVLARVGQRELDAANTAKK